MIKKVSSAIFKTFLLSLMVIADLHFAFAQSTQQGIIPNGKATFLDQNGKPLTSGTVDFYIPGTTTRKTTYQDIGGTVANTNPVVLDAAGRALLWGTGSYRQVVKDFNGNLIWDVTTSSAGSGSGGGGGATTGDGDLVGTIKPWAGTIAPSQYLFAYGQELSRTTYAALFTAITSSQGVFCNTGSAVLTGLGDTTNFWNGMKVETPCVPSGVSTVIAKTSSSVTLAVNANITGNNTAIFYPWGNGNGSTTFNLPDFRGIIPMGNNIMGGVSSTRISSTYFGNTNPNSSGALGGGQSQTLVTSNLPPYTPSVSVTDPGHIHTSTTLNGGTVLTSAGGSTNFGSGSLGTNSTSSTLQINSATTGITVTGNAQGGTSTPFGVIQPSLTVNYIIKVTPDVASTITIGVTALGGMTGNIACGTGLLCTGNVISSVPPVSGTNGVVYVPTIAALRALPVGSLTTGQSVSVGGYNSNNDGGGGLFTIALSNATDDGGCVINSTVGVASYSRVNCYQGGTISILYFGGKGDNSTDNTPAFNNMITVLANGIGSASPYGLCGFFPAGTYLFNTQPNDITFNMCLYGVGIGPVSLIRNFSPVNATDGLFNLRANSGGSSISKMGIYGGVGTTGGSLIQIVSTPTYAIGFVTLSDLDLSTFGSNTQTYTLYINGSSKTTAPAGVRDLQLRNVQIFGCSATDACAQFISTIGMSWQGGGIFSAGGTGTGTGKILVGGTAGVPSQYFNVNIETVNGGLNFSNCLNVIMGFGQVGATSGISVSNTSSASYVSIHSPQFFGTVQSNWLNSTTGP